MTFYKVHDNMQEVLAYKSDDNMGLGGIFHNMCMVLVLVLVFLLVLVSVLVFLLVLVLVFFFLVFPSEAA
jgi:fatty acid desaturase